MEEMVLICCQEMLCDLTGVNDAFPYGYWWDDEDGEPLKLHEWLSDTPGDEAEVKKCPYCQRTPMKRRGVLASRGQLVHRPAAL